MIDTKAIRIAIDKPRAKQMEWLAETLVQVLEEIDWMRRESVMCGLAISHGLRCTITDPPEGSDE
jgi:hypothetical protein